MIANKQGPTNYIESSRLHNDVLSKKIRDKTNDSAFNYFTDNTIKESISKCFQNGTIFAGNTDNNSIPPNLVDTETVLRGITRKNLKYGTILDLESDCDKCTGNDCLRCYISNQKNDLIACKDNSLTSVSTRNNTEYHRADLNTKDRYDFIYENLNDTTKIPSNGIIGVNSRLMLKDKFSLS